MRFQSAYQTGYFFLPVSVILLLAVTRCTNDTAPNVDPLPQRYTYKAVMVNPVGSMQVELIQGVDKENGKGENGKGSASLTVGEDRYQLFTNKDFRWVRGQRLTRENGVLISNDKSKSVVVLMSVDENGLSPRIYLGIESKNIDVTMSAYPSFFEATVSVYEGNVKSKEASSGDVISNHNYGLILNGEGEFKALKAQGGGIFSFGGTYEKDNLRLIIHEKPSITSPTIRSETFQATNKDFNILKSTTTETTSNGQGGTRTLTHETILFRTQ